MTQPGQGEDAGQLDLSVVADLRGFAARLRREVNAAAAKVQAKVAVTLRTTGLRTELRRAVNEAADKSKAQASIGVRIGVTDFRRAVREVADRAKALARIGVSVSATELRRAVKEASDKAKAKVKVDADTKPAAAKIDGLKDTRVKLGVDTKGFTGHVKKAALAAADVAGAVFKRRMGSTAQGIVGGLVKTAAHAVAAAVEAAGTLVSIFFKNTSTAAASMATNIATSIATAVTSGTAMTVATGGLNLLVGALLALASAAAIVATGFVALAPLVLVAGGLFGSLFTIVAGGISTVGVLALGFRGLGTAFGEVMEKGKATDETLKKLSPNARKLVKEFERLKQPLSDLRRFVQDKLLVGMNGQLRTLVTKWLPAMKPMLGDLAGRFNNFAKTVVAALVKPEYIANIKAATAGFGDFIDRIGESMGPLIDTFGRLAKASVPFLKELGDMIGGVVEKFSAWIKTADESGKLDQFMKDAAQALRDIWHIGGLVVGIVGEIIEIFFPGSKRASGNFLTNVKKLLQEIKDWLADPQNQKKIQDWIDKIQDFIDKAVTEWIPKIIDWMNKIDGWVSKVEGWIDKIKEWKKSLSEAWEEIKNDAQEKWDEIVEYFTGLPERVSTALRELPGKVREKIQEMANQGAFSVGYMIGQIVGFFLTLPGRAAGALASLPGRVSTVFNQARTTAATVASQLVGQAVAFFLQLPGRVGGALASLAGRVSAAFNAARSAAVTLATQLVGQAISVLLSLPSRARSALGDLGGVLRSAGNSLIQGLIRGIYDAVPGLESTLRWVTSLFPKNKGPIEKDRKLLQPAGKAIMDGLMRGIDARVPSLRRQLQGLTHGVVNGFNVAAADASPAVKTAGVAAESVNAPSPRVGQAGGDSADGSGPAPLIGSLTLQGAAGSFHEQLEEVLFQLRVIRRGGVVTSG